MRRDMDLVREMLRQIEAWPSPRDWVCLELPDRSREEVSYHVHILAEAGLIDALDASTMGAHDWQAVRLTWAGHEFLDAARNDTVWEEAKSRVSKTVGAVSFSVLSALLVELTKQHLGMS